FAAGIHASDGNVCAARLQSQQEIPVDGYSLPVRDPAIPQTHVLQTAAETGYVLNSAFGELAHELKCGVAGKEQHGANKKYRNEVEHHRSRMPLTALV